MADIQSLADDVIPLAESFIAALKAQGIRHVVTSTNRTTAEQVALYAQGRESLEKVNTKRQIAGMFPIQPSENQYTVTNADGIKHKSAHQGGRALDVVPASAAGNPVWPGPSDPRWKAIGEIGEAVGFEWGGRWKDLPDFPHYQRKA